MANDVMGPIRIALAVALLLMLALGVLRLAWQVVRWLADSVRIKPRVLVTVARPRPGREPQRPRSKLAWRHGPTDLPDRDG